MESNIINSSLAATLLKRLIHYANVLTFYGRSYRLSNVYQVQDK